MIDTVENDAKYLIMKRGVYYRPNNAGYTGIKDEAGRYSLDEISMRFPNETDSGLSFILENEAPDYSPNCFADYKQAHMIKKKDLEIQSLRSKNEDLRKFLLSICNAWIGGGVPKEIASARQYLIEEPNGIGYKVRKLVTGWNSSE